jgi:hypothetical protein
MSRDPSRKYVRVRRLILEDENGKACAWLRTTPEGPELKMTGPDGLSGIHLFMFDGGPRISLFDENGFERVFLHVNKDRVLLSQSDKKGDSRMSLEVEEQSAMLLLRGRKPEKASVQLCETGAGAALLMGDGKGKLRAKLEVGKYEPSLTILDKEERPVWRSECPMQGPRSGRLRRERVAAIRKALGFDGVFPGTTKDS